MHSAIDWIGYLAVTFILFAPVFMLVLYLVWETTAIYIQRRNRFFERHSHHEPIRRAQRRPRDSRKKAA